MKKYNVIGFLIIAIVFVTTPAPVSSAILDNDNKICHLDTSSADLTTYSQIHIQEIDEIGAPFDRGISHVLYIDKKINDWYTCGHIYLSRIQLARSHLS